MDGSIEVRYAGVVIGRGTVQPSDAAGAFVAFADPLPVGTEVQLELPTGPRRARIEHVVERGTGAETGMRVRFVTADGETAGVPENVEPETSSRPIRATEQPAEQPAVTARHTIAYGVAGHNPDANGKPATPTPEQPNQQQRSGKKKRR